MCQCGCAAMVSYETVKVFYHHHGLVRYRRLLIVELQEVGGKWYNSRLNTPSYDDNLQGVSKIAQLLLKYDKNTPYHIEKNAFCDIPVTVT